MTQKFYADKVTGEYLGAYDGPADASPYKGHVAVDAAPSHGLQRWDGAAWVDTPARTAADAKAALAATDGGMARVVEEIVDLLVTKGAIAATDLPQASRDRIAARKIERAKL